MEDLAGIFEDMQALLVRMIELLRFADDDEWAEALESTLAEMRVDPGKASAQLVSMYEGIGYLHGFILYKGGELLLSHTEEFHARLSALRELCYQVAEDMRTREASP